MDKPQVIGYRQLSQQDIDWMNRVKAMGVEIEGLLKDVSEHVRQQHDAASPEEKARIAAAEPHRWIAMARSDYQKAQMALTRAIAQPTSF